MMNNSPKPYRFLFTLLGLILLAATFLFGYYWGVNYGTAGDVNISLIDKTIEWISANLNDSVQPDLYSKVWQSIDARFIGGTIDESAALYGSVAGLVNSLGDPYSIFLDPELTEIFNQEISGNFEGVGVEIALKNDKLVVVSPLPDTPADRAGVRSGDHISRIDDIDTSGLSLDFAVTLIRGEKDTKVTLTILRSEEEPQEIEITREAIQMESVDWEIKETPKGQKVGYIEIFHFSEDTESLFLEAANAILLESTDGLILDLRGNAGGYLAEAINIASEFVEDGVIFIEKDAAGIETKFEDDSRQPKFSNMKTVILINGGSASASEILAGALRDNGLAEIVGEVSFGKGSVQELEEFTDGSLLKLTVAKWFTPSGLSIDEEGIEPDHLVELSEDDYNNDRDPQLDKAFNLIDNQ
ncbi:MAG: S41 family peptidase [Patescibacteria group bacterium]